MSEHYNAQSLLSIERAQDQLHEALVDALWDLMVALGKHTADMTPAQLADICPACDKATAALIATGRVLG